MGMLKQSVFQDAKPDHDGVKGYSAGVFNVAFHDKVSSINIKNKFNSNIFFLEKSLYTCRN
jgi:hypothetical protein